MTKILLLAKKRQRLSEDEFMTYWCQRHAPLVVKIPGVRRYVINSAVPDDSLTTASCDGVGEIWFDNLAALQEAAASQEGQAAFADRANFCSPDSATLVAEELQVLA
jgi:uncharacterized protein (TIGR02118 family)